MLELDYFDKAHTFPFSLHLTEVFRSGHRHLQIAYDIRYR